MRSPCGSGSVRTDEQRHHLEDDGADPDGERHRESADDRQLRILEHHPTAELEVERHARQRREPAPVEHGLPVVLDTAECGERAASARRRASSRERRTSRTRRSVSMSRWKRNSSSVRDSLARRDSNSCARVRVASSQLMGMLRIGGCGDMEAATSVSRSTQEVRSTASRPRRSGASCPARRRAPCGPRR
jgi:hypothetical protein